MHPDLKQFFSLWLGTVMATLFLVANVAFVSIPYTLGPHGDDVAASALSWSHHLT